MAKKKQDSGPYVLLGDNGTYYQGMVAIGPCFGGTVGEAKVFQTRADLAVEKGRHWAISGEVLTLRQAKSRSTQ